MVKERDALVAQYKELEEQSGNPTATAEAKAKAQSDAQAMIPEINAKEGDLAKFQEAVGRELQSRGQQFHSQLIEEISKIAADIAKQQGATLLLDKSGPSLIGVPAVVYSDPSADITDAVAAEINKTRPAPAAPSASAPAADAPAKN